MNSTATASLDHRARLRGVHFERKSKSYMVTGWTYLNREGVECVKAVLVKDGVPTNYAINVKTTEIKGA
jgi:hypothetical protein